MLQVIYVFCRILALIRISGVPERIRTSGPQIRNLMLYPAELRGRAQATLANSAAHQNLFAADLAIFPISTRNRFASAR